MADHFAPEHLIGHVKDADYFHVPEMLAPEEMHGHLPIPQPAEVFDAPSILLQTGFAPLDQMLEPLDFHLTKFMVLEVVVAVVCVLIFVFLAGKISSGEKPRGRFWNFFEVLLLFIRDEVARPAIGKHDADRFLPFLWTLFFFVLGCNLIGMVPWMGSPTGALAATGALALITFATVVGAGMAKMGVVGFWVGQVPHMELSPAMAFFLKPMIFAIEVLGLFIKHFVLSVRLLANMMAGHLVLAVLVAFVAAAGANGFGVFAMVAPASVLGATALSLLELFVAFLQAYIFTFLSALFIGMAVHPH